jgi:FtsH-binding integral membrane protein
MMDTIITYLGLFIFIGLTAYDTQKIKQAISMQGQWSIDVRKIALIGALTLYLDFINLFLYIVRLLGDRR